MGSNRSFILLGLLVLGTVVGGQAIFSRVPLDQALRKIQSEIPTAGAVTAGSEHSVIPLERFGGVWVTHVELNDLYQAKLIVDTGASFTTISEDLAFDAGIQPDPKIPRVKISGVSGKVEAQMGMVPRIRVGNVGRDDVRVIIHTIPNFPDEIDGLLGLSFFDRFLVRLDHSQGQLHLTPKDS